MWRFPSATIIFPSPSIPCRRDNNLNWSGAEPRLPKDFFSPLQLMVVIQWALYSATTISPPSPIAMPHDQSRPSMTLVGAVRLGSYNCHTKWTVQDSDLLLQCAVDAAMMSLHISCLLFSSLELWFDHTHPYSQVPAICRSSILKTFATISTKKNLQVK